MNLRILTTFIILFLVLNFNSASAQESMVRSISEDYIAKLITVARANYPRVKSYKARVDIARTNVSIAAVSIFDAVSLSYIYQPSNFSVVDPTNPGSRYIRGLQAGIFLNLGVILRTPMNISRAKAERRVAESEQAEYDITLATEVRKRYYVYMQRVAELKIQTNATQLTQNAYNDAEYRYKKGELTFAEFNQAQTLLTTQSQTKIGAEANLFTAKADLEELLGDKLENIQ
ncbi:TolC family protein [Mucilaginibacter limnophilus]|nr:TolC family protein [Mucilaginibacter limnophilus]